jgi:hypothetical protein
VLKRKSSAASIQSAGNFFDCDIASGTFDAAAQSQHLALAGSFEIAVELFVEQHAGRWLNPRQSLSGRLGSRSLLQKVPVGLFFFSVIASPA